MEKNMSLNDICYIVTSIERTFKRASNHVSWCIKMWFGKIYTI